ncbi:cell wall protein Ecm33 [Purpureocillium takamizusanense]|uniref:Cell wall protein Ecm33 n=1 Tax=Purpureocillium takamizusanense TaxID=2060973 RepID=A0A9Q8QLN0_9HYPO|nr:cell wall protein Ecm33 [Purpureocillium takamizusanense]UNI20782.1 cell wall protein Ecm33 [Purpureocillium takamizusanense]
MRSVAILSAVMAVGTAVVSGATTCTKDIIVSEPTPVIDCDVVDADINVDEKLAGSLSIEGPKQIKGNFNVTGATKLIGISSSSISSISGIMNLEGLTLLSSLNMQSLKNVNDLRLIGLPQLNGLTFGTSGVTKAANIKVTDTFISDLSGLNIATADVIDISNNGKLTTFNSDLVNVTKSLKLVDNGNTMRVNMSRLMKACEIEFRQVKSFDAPSLQEVCSIKFNDSPELLTVSANNLTDISASLTFINNKKLANVSFEALGTIKGDMTIVNNTALKAIDGFPNLTNVGNILVGGNFEAVKLPKLKDVKGSVTVTSTTDISSFCKFFDDAKASSNIRGKESCKSNNKNANSGDSTGGDSAGGNKTKEDAAGVISVNTAMLGLVGFAGIAQLL